MGWYESVAGVGPLDLFVVGIATAVSLLGMLLPKIGNFIGRLVLGEDPLLQRWQQARSARRERIAALRQIKRATRGTKKANADSNAGQPSEAQRP